MLLAEWYTEQRLRDARAYKFIITQYSKDAPEPGDLFPFLAHNDLKHIEQDDDMDRDEFIFHQVTASLSSQSRK